MKTIQKTGGWYKRAQEQYDLNGALRIERYGKFWAVYLGGQLLGVCVYKKGATAIMNVVEEMRGRGERIEVVGPVNEVMG